MTQQENVMKRLKYGAPIAPLALEPEEGNRIANLTSTSPDGRESVSEGDDHIRATKRAAVNSMPNIGPTPVILSAEEIIVAVSQVEHIGSIAYFYGFIVDIPGGWTLCDGNNGTPLLIGKFLTGYNPSITAPGDIGGLDTLTFTSGGHSIIEAELPYHSHRMDKPTDAVERRGLGTDDGIDQDNRDDYTSGGGSNLPTTAALHSHSFPDLENRPLFYGLIPIMNTGGI